MKDLLLAAAVGVSISPIVAGIVASGFSAVGDFVAMIGTTFFDFFFPKSALNDTVLTEGFFLYMRKNAINISSSSFTIYDRFKMWVVGESKYRSVAVKHDIANNMSAAFLLRGRPIYYHTPRENDYAFFRTIRGTLNVEKLIIDIMNAGVEFRRASSSRFCIKYVVGTANDDGGPTAVSSPSIQRGDGADNRINVGITPLGYGRDEVLSHPDPSDPFQSYAESEESKRVSDSFHFWFTHEDWYIAHNVPWRWGCLLHGSPGTGKTSLIRAVAQKAGIPVVVARLPTFRAGQMDMIDRVVKEMAPCVLLLDDLDCIFEGRETKRGGLSLSDLLDFLDGVEQKSGVAVFQTTNHKAKLDPALYRKGRVRIIAELPPLNDDQRRKVAKEIVGDLGLIEQMVAAGANTTGAEFKDMCIAAAEDALWSGTS
jgi:hypothetical protein